jgi:hypothetical protein
MDPLAKSGIETFNKSRVDYALTLCSFDEMLYHAFRTLDNRSIHIQDIFDSLFDHLHDGDALPGNQLASSRLSLASRQLAAKRIPKGADVAGYLAVPAPALVTRAVAGVTEGQILIANL